MPVHCQCGEAALCRVRWKPSVSKQIPLLRRTADGRHNHSQTVVLLVDGYIFATETMRVEQARVLIPLLIMLVQHFKAALFKAEVRGQCTRQFTQEQGG